jgi:membrane-associated HD superfamily phosphohydrolase
VAGVSPFVVPNSYYSLELTESAQQLARGAVQPITREFLAGEIVISRGDVISAADIEALQELGLIQSIPEWQELLGAVSLIIILSGFLWLYFLRRQPASLASLRPVFGRHLFFSLSAREFSSQTGPSFPYTASGLWVTGVCALWIGPAIIFQSVVHSLAYGIRCNGSDHLLHDHCCAPSLRLGRPQRSGASRQAS